MENHFHNDIRQVLFEYSNHNDNHGRCLYVVNKRNYLFTITALPKVNSQTTFDILFDERNRIRSVIRF